MRRRSGRTAGAAVLFAGGCTAAATISPPPACAAFGPEFYAQAERDFAPFRGLSPWDAQRTRNLCRQQGAACFVVQVLGGRLYVAEEQAGFQSRNRITMALLQRVAARLGPLPDAEFVVDTSDGYSAIEAPLFVIAKFPQSPGGILYPDFSSFAWPESECPSEPSGSHVWHRVVRAVAEASPPWREKADELFWRGAATSVYRRQVVPRLAAMAGANVSFLEWVQSDEGRQSVRSGSCVPLSEWCRHRFLANLPGNTMALSLKHRLLCGSAVVTPPLWYHEWYYSLLQPGVHYLEVDPAWISAGEALRAWREDEVTARAVGENARAWAERHLSDEAFDCYWHRLVQLAHEHFPRPGRLLPQAVPLEHAMLSSPARRPLAAALGAGQSADSRPRVDVAIVIPMRVGDAALMERARRTWLLERCPTVSHRHYFVLSSEDAGADDLAAAASRQAGGDASESDVLVVDSPHGYAWLLRKMVLAYRALLARLHVAFFVRADVDSVLPLPVLLPLLPLAARGEAVVRIRTPPGPLCGGAAPRWRKPSVGALVCQTECAVDRGCEFFAVDGAGSCRTFSTCEGAALDDLGTTPTHTVYEYRLRGALRAPARRRPTAPWREDGAGGGLPFVLGTVLFGNGVLVDDTHNPQWNNPLYGQDLGLSVYPPYPEASGYALSAEVAAFLARVGEGDLAALSWRAWAIEDAALGTALAGLNVSLLQLPAEVRDRMRVVRVLRNGSAGA